MPTKFSQFFVGGLMRQGDIAVGLRAGNNFQFNFPGTGVADADGNKMVGWGPSIGTSVNYINFLSAETGDFPSIGPRGTDVNIGVLLETIGTGQYIFSQTSALTLPVGTTGQRPVGAAGEFRYNSTNGFLEYYNSLISSWQSLPAASGTVAVITGTANQINVDSTDPTNPILSLSSTVIFPGTAALDNGNDLTFFDSTGVGYASFKAPTLGVSVNANYQWPVGPPSVNGYVLSATTSGIMSWIATSSGTVTSVSGTLNRITSTGGITPVIDISASYVGQSSITTVGALASGSLTTGFTPITVPIGGTGKTTFTAYSVICAGTTATGAFQNVSGVGSLGNVLTSQGVGALPLWAPPATSGTVTSVGYATGNSAALTLTGTASPITNSGSFTLTPHGNLLSFQILTSGTAATYTKPANINSILVESLGGGGGGGGAGAGAAQGAAGGGGASGGYCRKWIASAAASYTYTIGAAGAGGATGANAGGNGGNTTFSGGTLVAGGGGGGGAGGTGALTGIVFSAVYGTPTNSTGGDFNVPGQAGEIGLVFLTAVSVGGAGGSNLYGNGGGQTFATNAQNTAGSGANNYGSGGAGGATSNTASTAAGGAGTPGLIIIWEYS